MKIELLKEKQNVVLMALHQLFENLEIMTDFSREAENHVADMVVAEHRDVGLKGDEILGEYYFLPDKNEEQDYQSMVFALTLMDDLKKEHMEDVIKAISVLNFILPKGAFVVDEDNGLLMYRYVASFPAEESEEEMFSLARFHIAFSVQLVSMWLDPLMTLAYGTITYEEFRKIV